MGPPSSGGSTVGEALNILEGCRRTERPHERRCTATSRRPSSPTPTATRTSPTRPTSTCRCAACSRTRSRASAARADRRRQRAPDAAAGRRDPYRYEHGHGHGGTATSSDDEEKAKSTTHLTVADRWGNVVSYTFTIEQIGGSGMVVPGRGFLLNNELTDFNFADRARRTRRTGASGRARAWRRRSCSKHAAAEVALGSPGGATIITTVLQTLVNYVDFGQSLPDAVAAPRASQRNSEPTPAEPAFIAQYGPALTALGHTFSAPRRTRRLRSARSRPSASCPAARQQAVAEPTRRGGGHATVVSAASARCARPVRVAA